LRILITNNTLASRCGTELYVRDLASALLKRGHTPIAYSAELGEVARELREMNVRVVDNLDQLSAPPDLIHGQHHVETMTALLHFPHTPAVFFCHSFYYWEETPPRFPRILRYVAADQPCRDLLTREHAIPEESVQVILNFVDLERFKSRSAPLPVHPERALVFSNYMDESEHISIVREACGRRGIELEVMGMNSGQPASAPERTLGQYDIVFAKARCALEAMAVGAAVVLCDTAGVGPMVTTGELERLRQLNFGTRALEEKLNRAALERELARYDATEAAEVSRRIRSRASLDGGVDQIVALYQTVLDEHEKTGARDVDEEERAAAVYLRWVTTEMRAQQKNLAEVVNNSTTMRLKDRVLSIPVFGSLARSVARKAVGRSSR
jgi:glycosyltransferase involved in cell wall biosynthesis